jgi:hypothetical protein
MPKPKDVSSTIDRILLDLSLISCEMFKRESQRDRAPTPWSATGEEFKVKIEESGGGLVFFSGWCRLSFGAPQVSQGIGSPLSPTRYEALIGSRA